MKVLNKKKRAELAAAVKKHEGLKLPENSHKSGGYKWATFVTEKPVLVAMSTLIVLVLMAIPVTQLRLAFPGDGDASIGNTERTAYDLVTENFGPGSNGPLIAALDLPSSITPEETATAVDTIVQNLKEVEGVLIAAPGAVNESGDTAILQIIPTTGPTDEATKDLIIELRDSRETLVGDTGANMSITGSTAVSIDLDTKLAGALPVYIVVVVGLSLLVLLVVFRSILVPIKATVGFLLSLLATLGALVAVFQWGWLGIFDTTPIPSFLPIIIVGILFGLAMDYEFFLVSGMHESYTVNKHHAKKAVVDGFSHGARVVAAAAVIMVSVFSGFIFSHDPMIQMIGFALGFGILVDAFIVRMAFVPSIMSLLGDRAWWIPKSLARLLPDVSIEGNEAEYEIQDLKKKNKKKKK